MQTTTIKEYKAPITITALTCLTATGVGAITAVILDHHKASSWKLSWDITLVAPIYSVCIA